MAEAKLFTQDTPGMSAVASMSTIAGMSTHDTLCAEIATIISVENTTIIAWREEGDAYCTALIMSKIGRYMATTMPPTTTPRNTIITGSISDSRFDTAASTSSS